ncbi:MAG: DUF5711 family protein [Mobilitalea sp.]
MAKQSEEQSLREYGNRKKRYKKRKKIIIWTLLLVLIAAGIVYLWTLYNKDYTSYDTIKTVENASENALGYFRYEDSIVSYSKDGAVAVDKDGGLLWNGSYEMMDPIADTCGDYVVVADRGSKLIKTYDKTGEVGSIDTLYDIIKVEIAAQGVVVALMEDGETNYIKLYYPEGTMPSDSEEEDVLAEKETNVNKEGYPVDISISDDGEKLVVSYLSVTKGEVISEVSFYNFGEVGQNLTDRFAGGYEFKDMVVPRVAFLDNNTACAFKDDGIVIFSMSEIPNVIHEETYESKIKSILYSGKYTGVVLDKDGATEKQLLLYDLSGNMVLDCKLNFEYSSILLTEKEIIMYDNLSCVVMKLNGTEKFRYTFDANIDAFYPINELDRYFLVSDKKISEIMLVE